MSERRLPGFAGRWRRHERGYVSEYTAFMDAFLRAHPEVVEDQARGWDIYWNPEAGLERLHEAAEAEETVCPASARAH